MNGTLYLIPNSLGSGALDDVLPASVRETTAQLDYFIAENTKTARAFLKLVSTTHPLGKPLQEIEIRELNINTAVSDLPSLLTPLLSGRNAGLVSEAGVPAVADPGADLVRLAHEKNIRVKPLVGPSSLLLALMAGGLNGQSFAFHGYLPTDAGQRASRLRQLEQRSRQDKQTQMFIETPYRNAALWAALVKNLSPQIRLAFASGLTLPTMQAQCHSVQAWRKVSVSPMSAAPTVFLIGK